MSQLTELLADPRWIAYFSGVTAMALTGIVLLIAGSYRRARGRRVRRLLPPRPVVRAPPVPDADLLQFLNNASHDLASPLTPIRLQLHMLDNAHADELSPKQEKALRVVRRNVEHMGYLIEDLKEASRLKAGHLTIFREPVDLGVLLADAVESFQPAAAEAGIALTLEAEPLTTHLDQGRINQVLYNLLTNAIKFTPEDGSIHVAATTVNGNAAVCIRDSGLGLLPAEASQLFQPFSQVHGVVEKQKGSGLGLFIANGIVEAHGGRMWVDSAGRGQGSAFNFLLPLPEALM